MKKLVCNECKRVLGEMEKGKIHKRAVILCEDCMAKYNTYKSLADLSRSGVGNSSNSSYPEGFEELFRKFRK